MFDPLTVHDTATFDDPLNFPTGIPYVFVNGVGAKWNDEATMTLAGKELLSSLPPEFLPLRWADIVDHELDRALSSKVIEFRPVE